MLINIEIDENIFTLVNLYANNVEKNRNAFFKKVNNFIENYAIGILIVGGDLNILLHVQIENIVSQPKRIKNL